MPEYECVVCCDDYDDLEGSCDGDGTPSFLCEQCNKFTCFACIHGMMEHNKKNWDIGSPFSARDLCISRKCAYKYRPKCPHCRTPAYKYQFSVVMTRLIECCVNDLSKPLAKYCMNNWTDDIIKKAYKIHYPEDDETIFVSMYEPHPHDVYREVVRNINATGSMIQEFAFFNRFKLLDYINRNWINKPFRLVIPDVEIIRT